MRCKRIHFLATLTIFLSLVLFVNAADAQWSWNNRVRVSDDGVFMGGAGMAFIDGETFVALNIRTELALGNWGVGIDLPLRFNTNSGELRTQDWNSTYDYFRVLRYIRYGKKRRSPVYARLGTLDASRLGHGFILNYYTNEASYDDRKIGMEFDLKFTAGGMESITSNFEDVEIVGSRFYVLPLRNMANLWLLKKLTFGTTLITDRADGVSATSNNLTIAGLDVELPLLQFGPFYSLLYADHAKIFDYGSGQAVGLEFILWKLGGLMTIQTKLERRFLGKEFLPSYFDPFYEVQRFQQGTPVPSRKTDLLALRTSAEKGVYGELFGHVLNTVKLLGTFEHIDGQPNSGRIHLAAMLSKPIARFSARAVYDKTQVKDAGDVFSLDERSILRAGLGYQLNSYFFLFTDYIWTFEVDDVTGDLKTQRRIEPQLSFVMPLNFGGN